MMDGDDNVHTFWTQITHDKIVKSNNIYVSVVIYHTNTIAPEAITILAMYEPGFLVRISTLSSPSLIFMFNLHNRLI